jgi:sulfate adenylyltransferase subunit 1 (EFTu-like GTPase family)
MPWYEGPPLLYHLEHVHVASDHNLRDVRFPVQYVIRPMSDDHHDYRGYAGQIASGILRPGDDVVVLPSGARTRVASLDTYDGPLDEAFPTQSLTVLLEDHVDVSRGDMLAGASEPPAPSRMLEATVCWMADEPLRPRSRYAIKHTTRDARAVVDEVVDAMDVHTLEPDSSASELGLNDIGTIRLRTSSPLVVDDYRRSRATGSFILVDEATNATVGAGMVTGSGE